MRFSTRRPLHARIALSLRLSDPARACPHPPPTRSNSPGGVNFESAPFKLTRELLEVMESDSEGRASELFDYFKVGRRLEWLGPRDGKAG